VAILGLAFRPDTNDMRESPAIPIVKELLGEGAVLKGYDPAAMEEAAKVFTGQSVAFCNTLEEVVQDVDAIVLVTRWEQFRRLPEILKRLQVQPLVVDGRRLIERSSIARYEGIGV